jgi:hypothetical protein
MEISEESKKIIMEFLEAWWHDLTWQASQTVAFAALPRQTTEELYDQLLGLDLRQMATAAEGLVERNNDSAMEALDIVQKLCEWMWARPGMPGTYHIPEEFWGTPIGHLALRAHVWGRGDELLTLTQAAEISGRSVSSLSQLVDRGTVTGYLEPSEPNPKRRSRVLRSAIEAMKKK